ncbi:MAG: hypothetical protein ABL958_11890 [Bdellovibrionia bacterium]
MKSLVVALVLFAFASSVPAAEKTISFTFKNKDLTDIIESYAKSSGRKFVVTPDVRGKATVLTSANVTLEEAFNLLSDALASNGYAITERDDTAVVMSARDVQRGGIPVVTEIPSLKPERMVTFIYTCKHCQAAQMIGQLRMAASKNGEIYVVEPNRLVFTDFSSSLQRVGKLLAELDKPAAK